MTTPVVKSLLAAAALGLSAQLASAQAPQWAGEFERPFGIGFGGMEDPIETNTRDAAGNRVVVDGYIVPGGDLGGLPLGLYGQTGSSLDGPAMAIGNQLNVVIDGSWNTVIIDNTQINNGDQNASIDGDR